MLAHDKVNSKTTVVEKPLTTPQKQALLNDELVTFSYCFECPDDQSGSLAMVRMMKHARDLGMSKEDIIALVYRANDYWHTPMPIERIQRTILAQLERW
jgi:hypothetical protein